jgi:hypothetical protein
MANSKNNTSMIYLLHLLAIATHQVSASTSNGDVGKPSWTLGWVSNPYANDCYYTTSMYLSFGQIGIDAAKPYLKEKHKKSCCRYLGKVFQTSGFPGVNCTAEGRVTSIDWRDKNLKGLISFSINNLELLTHL